jgi:peptide/nickel transport system substrate-binding protein
MGKPTVALRALVLTGAAALALAACGGGGSSGGGGNASSGNSAGPTPVKGGTLTILMSAEKLQHLDPQLIYTGEDLAMLGAYYNRSLTAYVLSPDPAKATTIVGDLATDIGTHSADGKTWSFTLRDGVKWDDGTPLTCADVKYGISRTFATDVIQGGPTYAIQELDIPTDSKGNSVYKGPYTTKNNNTAAYDKAVVCDGSKITFHLNRPAGDFNYTTTLGMGAVEKSKDTDPTKYDVAPASAGPYKVAKYTPNQELDFVRNPEWSAASDPYRPAYPDNIVLKFKIDSSELDQRMIADAPTDQRSIERDRLQTASLTKAFSDPSTTNRRLNQLNVYADYIGLRVDKLNLYQRQAIAAALDRAGLQTAYGGTYMGQLSDGVISPADTLDYAPTGLWDTLLGAKVPDGGNVDLAKQLITKSGKPAPTVTYQFVTGSPTAAKVAGVIKTSEARAGITVNLDPLPKGDFYTIVFDPKKESEMIDLGWGTDWPNAFTVLPQLFGKAGGWNLSHVDDPVFEKKAAEATVELDRAKQATEWKALNVYAMSQAWVVPTRFENDQRLSGSKVHSASGPKGQPYLWAAYGSWPYLDLWVEK